MGTKALKTNHNKFVDLNNNKANKMVINLFKNNKFKNFTYISKIAVIKKLTFLTSNTNNTYNYLK